MKLCPSCNTTKPTGDFYSKASECKSCCIIRQTKRVIEKKRRAVAYKGGSCHDCGYNQHIAALQFHHLVNKDADWQTIRQWSWVRIKSELDKCLLLCANCHLVRHAS